jgi:hypothetical protein
METTTMTGAAMSPLHSFFANNLPLLRQQQAPVAIVNDNAAGLRPRDAVSERRRLYEAQQQRLEELFVTPPEPSSHQTGISRWESEIPDLLTLHSAHPLKHHHHFEEVSHEDDEEEGVAEPVIHIAAPPKIPQRRSSMDMNVVTSSKKVEDDDVTVSTAASTTIHSRDSQISSGSRRIEGWNDYALAPPRRRTSCIAGRDEVETNDHMAVLKNQDWGHHRSETRLQPTSRQSSTRSLDNHLKKQDSLKKLTETNSRKSKNAPRRPRRMKSMELPDDSLTSATMDSSSSSVGMDESSIRYSIQSVLDQVKRQASPVSPTGKLTCSEQIILKDAVKGVVGALRRNSQSTEQSPNQCVQ